VIKLTVKPKLQGYKEKLTYYVFENRNKMGKFAANDVAEQIVRLQQNQDEIRMVFAAAPSQNEFLQNLVTDERIKWNRIIAFHMDEYIGLQQEAPQLFQNFLKERLFNKVPFKKVHLINSSNEQEEERYTKLFQENEIDIVCLGIGENGHIAFNDPPVADFADEKIMKKVKLDAACRQQQVNDGCFSGLKEVPLYALTLTIPALMSAKSMYCVVPGKTKSNAVDQTLNGPVSTACPSTILRKHSHAFLYLDEDSYGDEMDGK
jgi:glucosamine-6-phosphate deaminase